MIKKWRELELLVKKIEKTLSPETAILQSPDHLVDKITGEEREVDISIRYSVGSSDILIVIECRDRSTAQDVRWIEEIKTKHNDLGASKVIAVSRTGFTKQAIKKAQSHNIELRTFDEINEKVIRTWNDSLIIEVKTIKYELIGLKYEFIGEHENVLPLIIWEKDPFKTHIIKINNQNYTVEMLIDTNGMIKNHEYNPEKRKRTLEVKFKKNASINTNQGELAVAEVKIILNIWGEKTQLKTQNIHGYKDIINKKLHQVAYYNLDEISDNNIKISAYRKIEP